MEALDPHLTSRHQRRLPTQPLRGPLPPPRCCTVWLSRETSRTAHSCSGRVSSSRARRPPNALPGEAGRPETTNSTRGDQTNADASAEGDKAHAAGPITAPASPTVEASPGAASAAQPLPPPLSPSLLAAEVLSGDLLPYSKRTFPNVPWGPSQLVQVMGWSTALAVLSATSASRTPQAAVLAATELQGSAVRHLGLEVLCCCLAFAVLYMGLRKSKPRAAGLFRYDIDAQTATTVAVLAALAYPLADPVLYGIWTGVEQALSLSGQLPDPGASLVAQLRDCQQASDSASVSLHLVASCFVGPLWEETFWRGFFLASMTRVLPLPACVAFSSGTFAALHLGPGNLLPIGALSAVCDLLYLRTGTLAAPLMFHAGWNAYQLAGILLAGKDTFV